MKRGTILALVVPVLLAGCTARQAASVGDDAVVAVPPHVEAAARFTLALEIGDRQALSDLIPPPDSEAILAEIALIDGTVVDDALLSQEWNGRVLVTTYEDITIMTLGTPDCVLSGVRGERSITIGLVESDGSWLIETVNEQPSYLRVIATGPAGQQCMDNMDKLYLAGLSKEFASEPLRFPDAPEDLVPQYLSQLPVCPSGGVYSFNVSEPVCTVHGGRDTYLSLE